MAAVPALIHVGRIWDDEEGAIETKTGAGVRSVPVTVRLRALLVAHGQLENRAGDDLVFGRTASLPFVPSTVRATALKGWKAAGLEPLTPHQARHCTASYLREAGCDDVEMAAMIGHSDARTTKRIYVHLFEDSRATIAAKLEAYHRT